MMSSWTVVTVCPHQLRESHVSLTVTPVHLPQHPALPHLHTAGPDLPGGRGVSRGARHSLHSGAVVQPHRQGHHHQAGGQDSGGDRATGDNPHLSIIIFHKIFTFTV